MRLAVLDGEPTDRHDGEDHFFLVLEGELLVAALDEGSVVRRCDSSPPRPGRLHWSSRKAHRA